MAAARQILTVAQPKLELRGGDMDLRKYCDDRARSLMGDRRDADVVVAEIAQFVQPTRSPFCPTIGTASQRSRAKPNKLNDGYGIRASEVMQNGMMSGLSSPSRPWFKTKHPDPAISKFHQVKQWNATVDQMMLDFMASTNLYGALKTGYGEIGRFGTEAGYIEEHWRRGAVVHPLTFGEYWLGIGDDLEPDTLLRWCPMTVRTLVGKYVADAWDKRQLNWENVAPWVKQQWDAGSYDASVNILHLCEPNPAWMPHEFGPRGMAYREVYWDPRDDRKDKVLRRGGVHEKPFWAARWDIAGSSPYGVGPGWNALADLKDLQVQKRRKGDATDAAVKPAMTAPASVKLKTAPGSVTHVSQADKDLIKSVYQVDYRAIEVIGKDVQDCRGAVGEYFYIDLFLAITEMDGIQPRNNEEIFSRNEEKLAQLGPVIERVNGEKLAVGIDRVFGICSRRGMFPDAPEELHDVALEVDFISILAQAQRAVGLSITERSLGFLGNMSAKWPAVLDNVDEDAVALDYLSRTGFPADGIRDPRKRDAIRASRASEIAAKQAQEAMPSMAQGAQAAELLSRTDLRGQPLLDALVPGV